MRLILVLLLVGTALAGLSLEALRLAKAAGTISLTTLGSPYTQDFNTLASTGTSSTVPTGWDFSEAGTNANLLYTAGTGSSNTGDTYSFGSTGNTERAIGGLQSGALIPTIGASFTNNAGGTITSLGVSYTGEQWRLGTAGRTDRLDFQYSLNATSLTTGTWTDVDALDFTTPTTTPVGALDGNAAANRTVISSTITGLSIANGAGFWIRWTDLNASGADDGLSVDDFSLTPNPVGFNAPVVPTCPPSLMTPFGTATSSPVSATDSDGTVTSAVITGITPSDPGTITLIGFTPATGVGGTATATLDVSAATPVGTYNVTIRWSNDDPIPQTADCTVAVTVLAPVVLTPIHDIQGSGSSSPLLGSTVSTSGVVTGLRTNGFFIQEPDASVDADPATSEGIFVFTSSAPPAAAALGNLVQVTGLVAEFIPSADPLSPPLTEIAGGPSVSVLSMGNPLPVPIALTATFPDPAGAFDQLERLEGMRVSASSFTVVGPTDGNVSEANATSTSNGVFFGTVTGVARPFREPGIQQPDPPPSGTIPPIPRFDTNPERIRVDSDAQPGSVRVDVATGQLITGMVGPLDYGFRAYTILPDPASPLLVSGSLSATPVPVPAANQFTVGSFNLERFFDTVNDPGGDPVLTATAFNNRLNKASLAIRNILRAPDILGVVEMENLTTLQTLATRISTDAIDAGQDDPNYQAYLVEGNDVGGIDVGFLVKSPRVSVVSVTQEGALTTWIDPSDNIAHLLNDRPPLMLRATVDGYAITVIVNHLRSFIGIESTAPDGLTTEGNRVRQKRKAQAEFLANLVQARQVADPAERIVLVGDFNAFQFNDGFIDVMGGIKGDPVPANEAVVGIADLVNPDLINLVDAVTPTERYSYVFEGNAQVLDHVLVTSNLAGQLFYARNDADFPETFRNDPNRPERISDHDIPVAYFEIACEVTCPENITVPSEPSQCGATVDFSTTETGCGSVVCTPPSGSFFRAGTTTVTCAEDAPAPSGAAAGGPGASCTFTVTVTDNQAPVIACPDNIAVSAEPGQCSAVVSFSPTATDDCPGVTVISSPPSGSTFPQGTTTVTATATDAAGNTATCSFTVTVADNQPPTIACPDNIAVSAEPGQCSAVVSFSPTATDDCPGVTVISSPPSGSTFPKGTTTVTATATDAAGNTATCSFTVTVADNQPPTIACPGNMTAIAPATCATVNYPVSVATDNCPGVAVSCSPPAGTCFPRGTTTVTCVATDTSGNTAGCSFTVTVFDVCVQDDTNPSRVALVNSLTGDYRFCCSGTTYSGRGTISVRGNLVTLEHNAAGRRVMIKVDKGLKSGTASIQTPPGAVACTIRDTNTADNQCLCQ